MEQGKIIRWLVAEGASVQEHQPILEIETDKAIGEVEAAAAGVLCGIRAREGAKVPVGEVIAFIAKQGEQVPALPPIVSTQRTETTLLSPPPTPAPAPRSGPILAAPAARRVATELGVDLALVTGTGPGGRIKEEDVRALAAQLKAAPPAEAANGAHVLASPVARKLAKEHGVDLVRVKGTGPGGRVTQADVLAYSAAATRAPEQGMPVAADGQVEWLELSSIQRITGERMTQSKQTVPHFTLSVEADMTEALHLRESTLERVLAETGERLSVTGILVKVVALALKRHSLANAEFAAGRIKVHKAINVGVAVGVTEGLLVPVIRAADTRSLAEITRELKSFQEKAKSLHFSPAELSDGTFTVSNLGMFGIDQFSAIINAPQSAILAVGRIIPKPVGLKDGSIALRPMMGLTLSVDHRVLDGVTGARFLSDVKGFLEDPYLWL